LLSWTPWSEFEFQLPHSSEFFNDYCHFIYLQNKIKNYPWGVWFLRNLWGVKKSYFRIIESYADIWLAPNQTHWISPNNTNSPHPLPHIKTISFFAGHFHFSLYSVFSPLPCILLLQLSKQLLFTPLWWNMRSKFMSFCSNFMVCLLDFLLLQS
jgi:hypothetical protein